MNMHKNSKIEKKNAAEWLDLLSDKLSKYNMPILFILLIVVLVFAYLAYTKVYENSIILLSLTFFLVLDFTMTTLLIGLRQSLQEIMRNKPLFLCFLIMVLALSIINMPVLMGDFAFNPTAIQQTILESCSVAGAAKIGNEFNTSKNKILDRRYLVHL